MASSINDKLYSCLYALCILYFYLSCSNGLQKCSLQGKGWSSHVHAEFLKCLCCLQAAWRGEMTNHWQKTVELLFLVAWEGWTPDNKKCMRVCVQKPQQTPCHSTPPSMEEVGLGWSPKSSKLCKCPHSLLRIWHKLIRTQVNQRKWSEGWLLEWLCG